MASSLIPLGKIDNLAPGQSTVKHWNNATPPLAVWYIQAIPRESSYTSASPAEQSVAAEVTKVWRNVNRTPTTSDVQFYKFEHEIWYEIKNVGTREVDVDVYASIIS